MKADGWEGLTQEDMVRKKGQILEQIKVSADPESSTKGTLGSRGNNQGGTRTPVWSWGRREYRVSWL